MTTEVMAWLEDQLAADPGMAKAVARRQAEMAHEGRPERRRREEMMATSGLEVTVPCEGWVNVRGDRGFLKAVLWLNGTPMHLEAVEVRVPDPGLLEAVNEEDAGCLDALGGVYAARWETMSLRWPGERRPRKYVAYAVPFGS